MSPKVLLRRRIAAKKFSEFDVEEFERIWTKMTRYRGIESEENYFQSQFTVDEAGRDMLDFVGRLESLEKDIEFVLGKLGLNLGAIPKLNVSRGKTDFRQYYTTDAKQLAAERYARDIELLGYRPWWVSPTNPGSLPRVSNSHPESTSCLPQGAR